MENAAWIGTWESTIATQVAMKAKGEVNVTHTIWAVATGVLPLDGWGPEAPLHRAALREAAPSLTRGACPPWGHR